MNATFYIHLIVVEKVFLWYKVQKKIHFSRLKTTGDISIDKCNIGTWTFVKRMETHSCWSCTEKFKKAANEPGSNCPCSCIM